MKGRKAILLIMALAIAAALTLASAGPVAKTQPGAEEPVLVFKTDKYSMVTHYMHEVYEHYTVAGKLVKAGQINEAILHLQVLGYYIDRIPEVIPDVDREKKPVNKELYKKNFAELKKFTEKMINELKVGTYSRGKPLPPPDVVTKTCDDCHKNQKVPPPW